MGLDYLELMRSFGCDGAEDCLAGTRAACEQWMAEIDAAALKELNADYACWLYCPDTPIDYPVVQAEDNAKYLHRLFNGAYNACGTLFIDYRNLPDFQDPNTLIYGHHMRNKGMFGQLEAFAAQAFYASHPYMLVLSGKEISILELFAGYTTSSTDHCYDIAISDEEDMATFVAEAKRQVFGRVNIDMIAGPSEILVVADDSCNPKWAAADLLSQAEHDRLASAVLVTDSATLAQAVSDEVERQLCALPRQEIARASIERYGRILVTDDLDDAIEAANELAPEHLELCVREPERYLPLVRNAGSVFMGCCCPESLGDYLAGPNHTLPTSGTARFSSPLGVDDFIKKTQYTYFTRDALGQVADKIAVFARAEGLEAHARAALVRMDEGEA